MGTGADAPRTSKMAGLPGTLGELQRNGLYVTTGPYERQLMPIGIDLAGPRTGVLSRGRRVLTVGLGATCGLVLVWLLFAAGAYGVNATRGDGQNRVASTVTTAGERSLELQSKNVERRRSAVVAYAASLADFKVATTRPVAAVGINLTGAELRRRGDVLAGLVLDCIDAVDGYNLAAQSLVVTQPQPSGLPERFVWAVDCASGQ